MKNFQPQGQTLSHQAATIQPYTSQRVSQTADTIFQSATVATILIC